MTESGAAGPPSSGPTRRTRQELRALLLDAGIDVLRQDGLGTGVEQLTFKRVFGRVAATTGVRVTNASVIGRIWENQADFQSAVLAEVAAEAVAGQDDVVLEATAAFAATADRSTPDARRAALREIMRLAAEANLTTGTTSRTWATVLGVWALVSGSRGSSATDPIYGAMRDGYEVTEARAAALTGAMMAHLGLRLRSPFDARQFAAALTALVEGCALRDRAEAGIRGIELPTGPGGAPQAWTVLGVGMDALADQFFELDPDWSLDGAP